MKWYKRYPSDFGGKTRHLSLAEVGAYNRLLDHYYTHEEPLSNERRELYRICQAITAKERRAVDRVAEEFFSENGSGEIHNKRADEEISKASAISQARRDAANKRHGNG